MSTIKLEQVERDARRGLDWVRAQMQEEEPEIEREDLAKIRDGLETTLAILEGSLDVPDPQTRVRLVRLDTGGLTIPVPEQPPFSEEERVRAPVEYDRDNPRIFGTARPSGSGGGSGGAQLSEADLTKVERRIFSGDGPFPPPDMDDSLETTVGRTEHVPNFRMRQKLEGIEPGDIEYFVVLDNPGEGKAWAAVIAKDEDLEPSERRVIRLWTGPSYQSRNDWRSPSAQLMTGDSVVKTAEDAKEDVRRKIVRKTNADGQRGGYYMVRGSKSADEVGFYARTKRQRNREWRELTGIEEGIFLYRSSLGDRGERKYCPL
jgi:hypothetical protein